MVSLVVEDLSALLLLTQREEPDSSPQVQSSHPPPQPSPNEVTDR